MLCSILRKLYYFLILIIIIKLVNCASLRDENDANVCGYDKCPKLDASKLNVHIIPQSHDDVGWRKTVDQYYYGTNLQYARGGVQNTLDSVIDELQMDPKKRFIYVEMAFFWKWWNEQDDNMKKIVRGLVNNGQLEFTNGGWVSNDEATTYYHEIIDQFTWGFRRLNDTFGDCAVPKVAWQVDPFGHSKEQASIYAQMSMDGYVFCRTDVDDRNNRMAKKEFEFVWRANDDLGKSSDIFTSIMQLGIGYGSPPGFCFDLIHCDDEHGMNDPVIDDPESEEYNVDKKVNNFFIYASIFSQRYNTNNILIPMGSDFQFEAAQSYFKNLDKLIKYVNERQKDGSKVNAFYSTPMCYLQAIRNSNLTLNTYTGDFFPYGWDPHTFWTGYFTSRPSLKYQIRRSNNMLQICKQLNALTLLNMDDDVISLKEEMGVAQHHDAITGTEKQHVAFDYSLRLWKGEERCQKVVKSAYKKLLPKEKNTVDIPEQVFCPSLNISSCSITESNSKQMAVSVYNPLGKQIEYYVRLPITDSGYQVLDANQQSLSSDIFPIPKYVKQISGRKSNAINELTFKALIPPLGFSTFFVKSLTDKKIAVIAEDTVLKGKTISVKLDSNGALSSITLGNGKTVAIKQSFYQYLSMSGDNKKIDTRASGAYIFRPQSSSPTQLGGHKSTIYKGKLMSEVQQNNDLTPWISQTIRVYADEDIVEFDWIVGPIPVQDKNGKEIIIRFDSDLENESEFFTDANGRQIMTRKRDFRPFKFNVTEPIASNYYPVTSRIFIRDNKKSLQMTVINDRAEGGGSIKDGSIELMVHRRLLDDDDFGVHEALNEPGDDGKGLVIRGKTYLYLSNIDDGNKFHRDFAQKLYLSPLITFANYNNTEDDYRKKFQTSYSALNNALPDNVHLLTLEQWRDNRYLLRLEHVYESKDDPNGLSKNATVELKKLFKPFTIESATETTLGANQLLTNVKRFEFKTQESNTRPNVDNRISSNLTITLSPMQIRTFLITISN